MFVSSVANNSAAPLGKSSVVELSEEEEEVESVGVDSSAPVDELEASLDELESVLDELESVFVEDDEAVVLEELALELPELLDLLAPAVDVELGEAVELAEDEAELAEDVEEVGFLVDTGSEAPAPPLLLNTTRVALAPLGTETTQKFAPPAPGPFI